MYVSIIVKAFYGDCDGIASLLCIDMVQACIVCTFCIHECAALCAVSTMIRVATYFLTIATNGL